MKELEIKGSSVENALELGLAQLNLKLEDISYEVISKGGFLKKAVIKISFEDVNVSRETLLETVSPVPVQTVDTTDDNVVIDFVQELLTTMGLTCTVSVTSSADHLKIVIGGIDTNFVVGYRGETLDSIQYLCLLVANKNTRFKKKLIIDAEGYREHREAMLIQLSDKLATKVIKSGHALELEPMNPYERRIIHTALQDNPNVSTSSEGQEPNRYIVISPKDPSSDMYDHTARNNFKKSGLGKTRSFGGNKRRF